MTQYNFIKREKLRLNGRLLNRYDIYKRGTEEKSELMETCERPGVTVVTSVSKLITQQASDDDIYCRTVYAKNLEDAKEQFYMQ